MYATKMKELFDKLGERQLMVLATSANDAVTARTMSILVIDGKFYFQTGNGMMKARQIAANDRVALCRDNIQIEGACREIGHPFDEGNQAFLSLYKKHYAGAYGKYSPLVEERVYEVTPKWITIWGYDYDKPYRDHLDCVRLRYEREYMRMA